MNDASDRRASGRSRGRTSAPTVRPSEALEARRLLSGGSGFVPGELLVGFRPGTTAADVTAFYADHGLAERESLDRHAVGDASRVALVAVPAPRTLALIPDLERDPLVAYAEPNYLVARATTAATPTEALYVAQHQLNNVGQWTSTPDADVDAPEAWRVTTGSPDVLVAVLDTGVDYTHPDLVANIWTNPSEVAGDGVDNDGDGYVDDVHGINTIDDSGDPMDDHGHGTRVAGLLGATPFNEGVVGVAWRVGIVPIKMVTAEETIRVSDVVQAYRYVNYLRNVMGRNVVATNNSFAAAELKNSKAARDAMAGRDQPGMPAILHVCAAGNDNADNDEGGPATVYPATLDLPNIVSVAAIDFNDRYADFTNYGSTSVDLAAPGAQFMQTTAPGGRYDYTPSGTSVAAPLVSGAAALVWSAFPTLTAAQVKARILDGVDPIGHLGDNHLKPTVTNGRLNIAKALAGAAKSADARPPAAVRDLRGVPKSAFDRVTVAWSATGDDGRAGRAAFYDLRFSTAPITAANWDVAERALGEPSPRRAGKRERFTVTGLVPGTKYFFALKVRDDAGNLSGLSDAAAGRTAAARTLFRDDVEAGVNGWSATGPWHRSTRRGPAGNTAWRYGVAGTGGYDTGAANAGTLTSPTVAVAAGAGAALVYREWREVEDVTFRDLSTVQVRAAGGDWVTVAESEFGTAFEPTNWQYTAAGFGFDRTVTSDLDDPRWVARSIDLSAFAGKRIQVRFAFDTADAELNAYEGWYVDSVRVVVPRE